MRLIDADKLKEDLQKHHDFFIDAWKENGVDKIEIPIPDKSRMDEIINCISMVVNAPTVEYTFAEAFQKTICENKLYCPECGAKMDGKDADNEM